MLDFQFLPIYIRNKEFTKEDIRIEIMEVPCNNPNEEEYRFRMKSRHKEEEIIVHRDIAIEHHQPREMHPHGSEHLQFKLYTEGFGKIRINLGIRDNNEYKKCIFGFLSILKELIDNFDKYHKNISEEILNLQMFKGLGKHRSFLKGKISESLNQSKIEMDTSKGIKVIGKTSLENFKTNGALLPFFEGIG